MEKSPAFQFYPKDWMTDIKVILMDNEVKGMYITLLCVDWLEDGILPEELPLICGLSEYIKHVNPFNDEDSNFYDTALAQLSGCFMDHPYKPGFITNPRLLKERRGQEERRKERSEAGKKGAESKWKDSKENKSNGLPPIAKPSNKDDTAIVLPMAKDSSSTPSATSSSTPSINNIKKEKIYKGFRFEDFSFGKLWGDKSKDALKRWVEFKTAAGHGKLLKSYQLEIEQFTDNPKEFVRLVDRAITQGWKGLNATVPFEAPKTNGFHKPEPQGRPQPEMFKDNMPKYANLTPEEAAKNKALLNEVLFSKIKTI